MTEEDVKKIIREELYKHIKIDRYIFDKAIQILDGRNILIGITNGTKIGTAATQKLAFYGDTPIVQPTTSVDAATFSEESGTAVNAGSTFDGYRVGEVVRALRTLGLLA